MGYDGQPNSRAFPFRSLRLVLQLLRSVGRGLMLSGSEAYPLCRAPAVVLGVCFKRLRRFVMTVLPIPSGLMG